MSIYKDIILIQAQRMKFWQKKIISLLLFSTIQSLNLGHATIPVFYANLMADENWQMKGNLLRCGLAYPLPDYGVAYFEQFATKPAHFVIRKWQENRRVNSALVRATPPVWKPCGKSFPITVTSVIPGKFGLHLNENSALKLLTFLSQGYQVSVRYRSEQNFDVDLVLSPIKFRKMYARYMRCVGQLLDFSFQDVAETTLYFPIDGHALDDKMKEQLRRIAQYVRADHQVEKVQIVGYTDDTGRNGYNNAISQDRAVAVSQYLIRHGLTEERLSVTWVGELKPLSRNDTDAGRAKNRRVEIKLTKK